jgi:formylmethanofuran dehydrogenase subunit B
MSALKNAFVAMINGTESWAKQLEIALGKKKYLAEKDVVILGEAVCEKYKCYVDVAENGMYRFYKTEEVVSTNIHDGAKKCWQRHVAQYHNITRSNRGGKGKAQQDVVDIGRRRAEKFAEAHKVVEIRSEIKLVEAYLKSLKAYV